jgi:riboflavin kinase/FMN adenylyltransferase
VKVHTDFTSYINIKNPVVTVGTFDGVHLGHQKILNRIKKIASSIGGETVLLTFHPHPRTVLFNDKTVKLIHTLEEKIEVLEKKGLDHLVIYPFTRSFSTFSAQKYVEELIVNKLKTYTLVIGYDHHFGNDRKGNIELLEKLKDKYHYNLEEISAHEIDAIKVSSTKVRNAIYSGEIHLVPNYTGFPFHFSGIVIKGDGIGKTINYPTANISLLSQEKIIPKKGVYAVKCELKNKKYYAGIMNIGNRPTIGINQNESIEIHLFNFNKTIYGETLKVDVIKNIREEQKFKNIEALKSQIAKDCIKANQILSE